MGMGVNRLTICDDETFPSDDADADADDYCLQFR